MFDLEKSDERGTAMYVRCSPADGDHPVLQSVKAQIHELKALAKKRGCEYVSIYGDCGGTGMDFFWREGFQLMLSHAHSGHIGCVLMTEISRLGCEFGATIQMEQELKELGVEIIYAHAAPDSGSMEDFLRDMTDCINNILSDISDDEAP